jgi:predicted Zn-dependent protease
MTIELSQTLNALGHTEDAISHLFAYLDDRPNDTRVLRALAEIHEASGNREGAEQVYRVIYDLDTDDVVIGTALADVQIRAERFQQALETLNALIDQQPSETGLRRRRAETLLNLGQQREAHAEAERILRPDPTYEFAVSTLAGLAG